MGKKKGNYQTEEKIDGCCESFLRLIMIIAIAESEQEGGNT